MICGQLYRTVIHTRMAMDFLSAFKEPAVIICLTFSLLFYIFPNHGRRFGDWLVSHLGDFSQRIRILVRVRTWRRKKQALKQIYSPYEMQWLVTRTYSLMLLFGVSITTYVTLLAIGPLRGIGELPVAVQYLTYSPILVFEILWLMQREATRSLIKASLKRVTSQSTSRLRRRSC